MSSPPSKPVPSWYRRPILVATVSIVGFIGYGILYLAVPVFEATHQPLEGVLAAFWSLSVVAFVVAFVDHRRGVPGSGRPLALAAFGITLPAIAFVVALLYLIEVGLPN